MTEVPDPYARYLQTGADVLRNRMGLNSNRSLDAAMTISANAEWAILKLEPIPDELDLAYLQSIHRRFMGPVVDWAGEIRAPGVEVSAGTSGLSYLSSRRVPGALASIFERLRQENYLRDLHADEFALGLAKDWTALSYTHPFVDGNTRTQSAFVDRLATQAGHSIDWGQIDVNDLRLARIQGWDGMNPYPLAALLRDHIASARPEASTTLSFGSRVTVDTVLESVAPLEPRPDSPTFRTSAGAGTAHSLPPDSAGSQQPRLGL